MISKEILENYYIQKRLSIRKITKLLNVSDPTVLRWLRKHNIPTRSKSEALKGKSTWSKNKHLSEKHRKGISDSLSGEKHFYFGKHLSVEHRRNISDGVPKGKDHYLYGEHLLEETKRKIGESTTIRMQTQHGPYKDTKPELKMKEILNELNISFEHQFRLGNRLFDFHILNTNILVEVDGDYFHGNLKIFSKLNKMQKINKQRDIVKDQIAKESNFVLLRFWESDILKNTKEVKKELKNFIGGEK